MKNITRIGGYDAQKDKDLNQTQTFSYTINNTSYNGQFILKPLTTTYTRSWTTGETEFGYYIYRIELTNIPINAPIIITQKWNPTVDYTPTGTAANNIWWPTGSFKLGANNPIPSNIPKTYGTSTLISNGSVLGSMKTDTKYYKDVTYYNFTKFLIHFEGNPSNSNATGLCTGNYDSYSIKFDETDGSLDLDKKESTNYQSHFEGQLINIQMQYWFPVQVNIDSLDVYINTIYETEAYPFNKYFYFFHKGRGNLYLPGELIENQSQPTKFTNTGNLLIKNDFNEGMPTAAYKNHFEAYELIEY